MLKSAITQDKFYGGSPALRIAQKSAKRTAPLETDVNDPDEPDLQKYPTVKEDHHLLEIHQRLFRMMLSGNLNVLEIQELMTRAQTHHDEA